MNPTGLKIAANQHQDNKKNQNKKLHPSTILLFKLSNFEKSEMDFWSETIHSHFYTQSGFWDQNTLIPSPSSTYYAYLKIMTAH